MTKKKKPYKITKPSIYPMVLIGECVCCRRISAREVPNAQKRRQNHYCGETCLASGRKVSPAALALRIEANRVSQKGRKSIDDIPTPNAFETALWR